jgi:hypothetical protein
MFSVNSTSTSPHIYLGSYPSYQVYPQHANLNWNHAQSFGGDNRSFSPFPSPAMHSQSNSFQQLNAIAAFSNQAPHNWSYVPQTPIRLTPSPFPNVYASYNLGPMNPSPLYSSHSSIGGGTESSKSDIYSSSSSLNNGGVHFSSLAVCPDGEQPSSLTHSATFPKQVPAKKQSSRIHDTPAAAGLRNAVLNSDQAQEYFRMKQSGLQYGSTGNLKIGTSEQTSGLQKQSSSEVSRRPSRTSLSNSGVPSPWTKTSPGSSDVFLFVFPICTCEEWVLDVLFI